MAEQPSQFQPGPWVIEFPVTCVVCPGCAFTFDECHSDPTGAKDYTCPCCGTTNVDPDGKGTTAPGGEGGTSWQNDNPPHPVGKGTQP